MSRFDKLKLKLKAKQLAALVVSDPYNIYYLSGFRGLSSNEREAVVVVDQTEIHLFVPWMYETESKKLSSIIVHLLPERTELLKAPFEMLSKYQGAIGLEADNLTLTEYEIFSGSFKNLITTQGLIEELRMVKDNQELDLIKQSVKIADLAFAQILPYIRPGITEKQISRKLVELMEQFGAEDVSFPPIVASGANSALPHHFTSNKKIQSGEAVLMDFGAKVLGYCSDLTRVVYLGKAPAAFKQKYELVKKVNQIVCQQIKPGMNVSDTQRLASQSLGEQARFFTHSIGHGVGLNIHEAPFLRNQSGTVLKPGMVVTIEPGLYYPDKFGIRVEDYGVVSSQGFKILSQSFQDLIEISP